MRWMGVINFVLAGVILASTAFFIFTKGEETLNPIIARPEQKELPKSSFAEADDFFQEIGEGPFKLAWVPPQMQLPDLRQELLYYGKNCRPDSLPGRASFHFSLKGTGERSLVREGEKNYIVYQGSYSPKLKAANLPEQFSISTKPLWGEAAPADTNERTTYVFSPGNQPTPLWFEVKNAGEQTVEVRISMLDEKGALVTTPANFCIFHLQLQDFPKSQVPSWDVGSYRVDSTLLVRQKARWVGTDIFLEKHGGNEYAYTIGKERIDFLDGPTPYSCFIKSGDFLVWKENQWIVAESFEETQRLPLMTIKRIDEKIISFELWDPEGKGKIVLSLMKAKDHNGLPNLSQEFKFVGAKTWAQFIVECKNGGRMTLKPHDWLVLTQEGWKKLDSAEQIDAFVEQSITGPLFILEKMTKHNGRQVLIGHLYNTTRTEVESVELTSSSPTPLANFYRHIPINPPIQPKPALMDIQGDEE